MTDIITLLDNNGKYAVHTGGNIHGIFRYLEMIGSPTTLTTSGQRSYYFGPQSSINNDKLYIQESIASIPMIQKSVCECCGINGHKDDS